MKEITVLYINRKKRKINLILRGDVKMNFNKVVLMGHLTADPEMNQGKKQKYVKFSIAINRTYKDIKEVHYINCRAFGQRAETINNHFSKGRAILIEGRLDQSRWTDTEGKNRSMLAVVVENFEFIDAPKKTGSEDATASALGASPQSPVNYDTL